MGRQQVTPSIIDFELRKIFDRLLTEVFKDSKPNQSAMSRETGITRQTLRELLFDKDVPLRPFLVSDLESIANYLGTTASIVIRELESALSATDEASAETASEKDLGNLVPFPPAFKPGMEKQGVADHNLSEPDPQSQETGNDDDDFFQPSPEDDFSQETTDPED